MLGPPRVLTLLPRCALAGLLACGSAPVRPVRHGSTPPRSLLGADAGVGRAPEVHRATSPRAGTRERTEPPWSAFVLEPSSSDLRCVSVESDGSSYVLLGGARGRVRGSTTSWAPDLVLGGIAAAVRADGEWLFAGNDGALYRAPFFTAPLERVGATDGSPIVRGFASTGRLLARDARARLWIGSRAGFSLWTPPDHSSVLDAGFASARFGVVVLSPGRALLTRDGGAHWAPAPLASRAIASVALLDDGFVAYGPDGAVRLRADGPAEPFSGIAPPWDATVPNSTEVRAIAAPDLPGAQVARLTAGAIVLDPSLLFTSTAERFGATVRRLDAFGDDPQAWQGAQPPARFDGPGMHCRYFPWAGRLLAFCKDPLAQYRLVLFTGNGIEPWTPLPFPGTMSIWGTFGASMDGRTAWSFGQCDSGHRTLHQPWCWFDGDRWIPVEVERRSSYVASFGDQVVYRLPEGLFERGAPGPLRVRSVRAAVGDGRPPRRSDSRYRLSSGAFLEDGTFHGLASIGHEAALAIGDVQGELAILPLPPGATSVAMATARRGIAAGQHLNELWTTEDGGRSWSPLPLPIRGSARGVSLGEASSGEERVRCSPHACTVGARVIWTTQTLAGGPPVVMHAAPSPEPPPSVSAPPAVPIAFGHLRCAPSSSQRVDQRSVSTDSFGAGAWFRSRPALFEWGGVDPQGAFRFTFRGTLPRAAPGHLRVFQSTVAPRFASRGLTLLERCDFTSRYGGSFRSHDCSLIAVRPGQPARVWLDPLTAAPGFASDVGPRIAEVLLLGDGTFGVHLINGREALDIDPRGPIGLGTRQDIVLRLSADGAILERSSFAWRAGEVALRALAVDHDDVGLVILRAGERALRFHRGPNEEGRLFAHAPLSLRPCGDASGTGVDGRFITTSDRSNVALSVALPSGIRPLRLLGSDGVDSTVERGPSGLCVRRVTAGTGALSALPRSEVIERLSGALVIDGIDGAWRARSVAPDRQTAMQCVPVEERE
jgi:hypothetical protein